MKKLWITIFSISSISLWLGCSSVSKKNNADSFTEGVRLPEHRELQLNNGMQILFIKDSTLPRISMMAVVRSGAINDPKGKSGLSYLTGSLLDEGTLKHSSTELAEGLEQIGADLSVQPSYDFTNISIRGLAYTKETLLDSLLEVLLTPRFEAKEFDRIKKQIQGSLTKIEDDPDQFADRLFSNVLFQDHPYALAAMGDVKSVANLELQDVRNCYKMSFTPKRTLMAVVGDFDDTFINRVTTKLDTWIVESNKESFQSAPPRTNPKGIYLKHKKGLVQTQIRIGHTFIARTNEDFLKVRAANMALGGAFASRLNMRVRDELGLTYGISSGFEARKFQGPFVIDTFTRNAKVRETIGASLEVFKKFVAEGITEKELQASKSVLVGQFPRAVETMDALAYQMLLLRYYGIPDSYLTQFVKNVNALTLSEVNASVKKYFHPEDLEILVYSDEGEVIKQLNQFGAIQKL